MSVESYLRAMPKVELHVHLEGSIRPATLLTLARRHHIALPADTVEGVRRWYTFTDFAHFVEIYIAISSCLRAPEDIELIAREFLKGQAAQNIRHSEVTYTAYTIYEHCGIPFREQLDALRRAQDWAQKEFGVTMSLTLDIAREEAPAEGLITAEWAVSAMNEGVSALGLGGSEIGHPPEKHKPAFDLAWHAGLPSVPHAGETAGPESIWGALHALHAVRIGHGVQCLRDPALVEYLRANQIPLEVCPTSNVCLGIAPTLEQHPLPRLLDAGLCVTINSDDPPMFNTTLNAEYVALATVFGLNVSHIEQLSLNALRASFLPVTKKRAMEQTFVNEFTRVRREHLESLTGQHAKDAQIL
jgi:adenosine deaminase